jgi:hypothetical protein
MSAGANRMNFRPIWSHCTYAQMHSPSCLNFSNFYAQSDKVQSDKFQSNKSLTKVEQKSNKIQTKVKQKSNKSRTKVEQKSNKSLTKV